jgi:hypothetical protein
VYVVLVVVGGCVVGNEEHVFDVEC